MYYSDDSNRVYQLLCSTDEPGSNLGTTYQPDLQSCVDSCGTFAGCVGVSYTEKSGSCSYKSNVLNRVGTSTSDSAVLEDYICPGADGTRLIDSSGSVYEILCNTFFPASSNITSSLATSDLASCSEICSSTSSCAGFTFQDGSCTLVSNRNSNDGVLQMNVATAILIAKRVAQAVSSGMAPYRSTSLVSSLPVDVSRTPSSTLQDPTSTITTSTSVIQVSLRTSTVGTSSITLSSFSPVSGSILLTSSPTIVAPYTMSTENTESAAFGPSSRGLISASSSSSLSKQATAGTTTTLRTPATVSATVSISSTSVLYSVSSSIRSLSAEDLSTTIDQSSQTSTALLTPKLSSVASSISPSVTPNVTPNVTPESSLPTPVVTVQQLSSIMASGINDGGSETLRTTTSGPSSRDASSPGAAFSYNNNTVTSTYSTASSSVLRTVSYSPEPSGLPPQTNYSCPTVDGDVVQANTGGYYTIGCDDETTGYDVLVASAPDFNDCMTYCDQAPGCTAWTYVGNCYLKTGASASDFSFRLSTRGAISGIRSVPASGSSLVGTTTRVSATISPTPVAQTAASAGPTNDDDPVPTLMDSPTSSSSSTISEALSTTSTVSLLASVQTSEGNIPSTTYRSTTATLLSPALNTLSNSASQDTTSAGPAIPTSGVAPTATGSDGVINQSIVPQSPSSSSLVSSPSVTNTTTLTTSADAASTLTSTTSIVPNITAAASSSVSCFFISQLLRIRQRARHLPRRNGHAICRRWWWDQHWSREQYYHSH